MANTVSSLSYANTFGDWVVTTNALVKENNDLAANNYIKPTGTLYLNDNTLGLQVANNAVIAGQLQVQGIGSSGYIQNNLRVDGTEYLTNTSLSLVASGQANVSGPILAMGPGTGLAVSNNTTIGGTLAVTKSTTLNDTLTVAGTTAINNNLSVLANTTVTGNIIAQNYVSVTHDVSAVNYYAANTLSTYSVYSIGDSAFANNVVTVGSTYTNKVQANTLVNTATLSVTTQTLTNRLQSNTSVNTATLSVTGNTVTNNLQANTSLSVPTIFVTSKLDANSATSAYLPNVVASSVQVSGDFVINGQTVYASNNFTLASGVSSNQNGTVNIYRPVGSNATLRWNESSKIWDVLNVTNSTYYRILTDEYKSDSISLVSSTNIATSQAANTLSNSINTLNSSLAANVALFTSIDATQNTNISNLNTWLTSNVATIGGIDATQNTNISNLNTWLSSNVVSLQSQISSNVALISAVDASQNAYTSAAYSRANTSANSFVGTSGTLTPTSGSITFTSTNGVTSVGSGNTITINTPQDVRTTANPTFNGLSLTNALPITQGGTGATSSGAALTALLPTGTTAGYVLTTSGPGSFYWAAVGSITAIPGTTIQSSRLSYTANGSGLAYTTPTYVPGASQLRVYIDGVRQFPSEYTETSSTVVTFNSSPPAGTKVLVEVDGYINNPYYANNITFTAPFGGIVTSANTIQLAIQDVETRKAALSGASFTGVVTGLTVDTNASNTAFATTAFVKNSLNSSNTFTMSISGNAGTVTNGVYTNGSYSNPSWITALAASKITGTVATANNITDYTINQSVGTSNNVQHASLGIGTAASGTSGEIRATNNITAYYSSDRKYKENVQNIPNALSKVECIGGKLFDWTDDYIQQHGGADGYFVQKSDFGVIAQDVQQVFPQAVRTREDGSLAVDYAKLSALAFAAIVELKAEIDALKGK